MSGNEQVHDYFAQYAILFFRTFNLRQVPGFELIENSPAIWQQLAREEAPAGDPQGRLGASHRQAEENLPAIPVELIQAKEDLYRLNK